MGYVEQEYERLADLDIELRELAARGDRDVAAFIERLPAAPVISTAAQVQTTAELNAQRTREWERWADARIARALAEHDRVMTDAFGEALAEYINEKLAKLEARIMAALERKRRGFDDGDVLDLPSPLLRKRHDAA